MHILNVSEERAKDIEKLTRGQADNKRWFLEQQWRITASGFGEIFRITPRRQIRKLCESIACPKVLNHGKMYEQKAIKQFEEKFDIKTQKCGFTLTGSTVLAVWFQSLNISYVKYFRPFVASMLLLNKKWKNQSWTIFYSSLCLHKILFMSL